MAYKKLIKVSNVCQLLDKSKFPATQTNNGVTFTNNGDGSVTVNGTATADAYYNLMNIGPKALRSGLIAISLNALNGSRITAGYLREWVGYDPNNGYCFLTVNNGKTVNNVTVKPQLFDLTEMYGAGNEPTTVEQFRQDFTNDLYDYSPRCWLTSYKRVFTCKTKNLFDINSAKKVSGISFSKNGNQITASQNRAETWKSANVLLDTSLIGKTISLTALAMTDGINNTCIRIQWLANSGLASGRNIQTNIITGNSFQKLTLTGVVPESPGGDFTNLCIMFYSNANSSLETGVTYSSTFTNIQIELGDTATDYVPYGIIPSYQRNLTCKTKNLFDIPLTRGYPSNTSGTNTTIRTFTIGTYILGLARNNSYAPYSITNVIVSKNSISFKLHNSGFGLSIPMLLTVGKTYTISCKADNNFYPAIGITYYREDGTLISYTESEVITNNPVKSFTVPENTYYTLILFYGRKDNEYTFSNIQLELGDTATEYVPYGHL